MRKKYAHNGYVIYSGPSELDGAPIIMVATGFREPSENTKTGAMIQTWIIRSDVAPTVAVKNGADASVCGDCPLRPDNNGMNRACYVNLGQAPNGVFNKFHGTAQYPSVTDPAAIRLLFDGLPVRLGSYGDPAAVPIEVVKAIVENASNYTAYTHQWRTCDVRLKDIAMASVETMSDYYQANTLGWRTFRLLKLAEPLDHDEILCPASEEAGKRTTCLKCSLCDGARESDRRKSIGIWPHGVGARYVKS